MSFGHTPSMVTVALKSITHSSHQGPWIPSSRAARRLRSVLWSCPGGLERRPKKRRQCQRVRKQPAASRILRNLLKLACLDRYTCVSIYIYVYVNTYIYIYIDRYLHILIHTCRCKHVYTTGFDMGLRGLLTDKGETPRNVKRLRG